MQSQRREGRDEGVRLRVCARCGYMHVVYGGGGGGGLVYTCMCTCMCVAIHF